MIAFTDTVVGELERRLADTPAAPFARRVGLALAQGLADVVEAREREEVSLEEARALLRLHMNHAVSALAAVRAVDRVAAQNAINGAIEIVRAVLVKAAGAVI